MQVREDVQVVFGAINAVKGTVFFFDDTPDIFVKLFLVLLD
jgi:hypothetical protein